MKGQIYRCEACRNVVLPVDIAKFGACEECACKRIRVAFRLTDYEVEQAKERGYEFDNDGWREDFGFEDDKETSPGTV